MAAPSGRPFGRGSTYTFGIDSLLNSSSESLCSRRREALIARRLDDRRSPPRPRLPELLHRLRAPFLLGLDVDRGRRQRRVAEVLLGDLDRHAAGDGVTGVRVAQPMRAGLGQARRALVPVL